MGKKLDKAFDAMRESNRLYIEDMNKKEKEQNNSSSSAESSGQDISVPDEKRRQDDQEKLPLEKGDVPAMIISALLVFGPVFLILIVIVVLAWIFLK